MDIENTSPLSKEDARASLAEIDHIMAQTRKTIAAGSSAPIVILWGVIWAIAYARLQFSPHSTPWLWPALDIVGIAGTFHLVRRSPVKRPKQRRVLLAFLILFAYAIVWRALLCHPDLPYKAGAPAFTPSMARRIAAYFATIPMFGYVMLGLWLDRFFIWLGILVTIATLIGLFFAQDYYYLWLAISGGGSLIIGGVFIRKFWK
jgi:hypothetical protein